MTWRHPSDLALDRWSSGSTSRRTARHAGHCPLCLERLEALTELEPVLRSELESDRMPRAALETKLWDRLEATIANREALSVITDLMDVGPQTTRLLLEGTVDEGRDDD